MTGVFTGSESLSGIYHKPTLLQFVSVGKMQNGTTILMSIFYWTPSIIARRDISLKAIKYYCY